MPTLTVTLPDTFNVSNNWKAEMFFVAKLYEDGRISSGDAAEMVGLSKHDFLKNLGDYGVSVFGQTTIKEVLEDAANA